MAMSMTACASTSSPPAESAMCAVRESPCSSDAPLERAALLLRVEVFGTLLLREDREYVEDRRHESCDGTECLVCATTHHLTRHGVEEKRPA